MSPIDPEIAEFARRLNAAYEFEGTPKDITDRRRIAERVRETWRAGGPAMAQSRELTINGLRARLHRPATAEPECPIMLYIHGGGWVLFSIDTHDRLMREYAHRAGIAVLGIDYSLSPEAKFPGALNEISDTLEWIEANATELGFDRSRIFVGGDSAGANLSVACCIRRREEGLAKLAGMMLSYGAFDPDATNSYQLYSEPDHTLQTLEMDAFWDAYTDHPGQLGDPLVAPLKADLHELPPAFVAIAECDILADCNHAFVAKLRAAGVPVTSVVYPGATHSFLEAVSISRLASQAIDDQANWLRAHAD